MNLMDVMAFDDPDRPGVAWLAIGRDAHLHRAAGIALRALTDSERKSIEAWLASPAAPEAAISR